MTATDPSVVIVGAGMSGIGMAARLLGEGYQDVTIVEKAGRFGGTWRENTYPGVGCDVPSAYYSYRFAPNPGWSRIFAPGAEISDYFERVAAEHDLPRHTRFSTTVLAADWSGDHWDVALSDGTTLCADVLIAATGILHHLKRPRLDGLETFAGACFHSAEWDPEVTLDGRRVGLVGNGSTGVQIITALTGRPAPFIVFQRTPQWVLPLPNVRIPTLLQRLVNRRPRLGRVFRRVAKAAFEQGLAHATVHPGLRRRLVAWACRRNLARVRDPEMRLRLTPDYEPMCRRLVVASGYYEALQHDQVELVTAAIERIEPAGVRTADGRLHELDVLILATGFDPHAFMRSIKITGLNGRTLEEEWADGARGYRTVALPDFPNLFTLLGPHSPFGNQSQIEVAETQIDYIIGWLDTRRRQGWTAAAPTRDATDAFNADVRSALQVPGTIWVTGCESWYLGNDGLPELWPWDADEHRRMLATPDHSEWTITS